LVALTDTHCHLNLNLLQQDLAGVLARAWDQGLGHILIPGIDLETSRLAVEMAQRYPHLHAAVGIHPNDALEWNERTKEDLRCLAELPVVVAIGEIGLDYYHDRAPKDIQLRALHAQLEMALEVNKPVILHSRDAITDLWPIMQTWQEYLQIHKFPLAQRPGVFHSFEGNMETAAQIIQAHFYLGISGPVTFKSALQRQKMVAELPLESLLLETDAPFLAPHPHRGERNEPAYVALIARKIADLKQIEFEQVIEDSTRNANVLFEWDQRI
jgi:TatD DNase family protein